MKKIKRVPATTKLVCPKCGADRWPGRDLCPLCEKKRQQAEVKS